MNECRENNESQAVKMRLGFARYWYCVAGGCVRKHPFRLPGDWNMMLTAFP